MTDGASVAGAGPWALLRRVTDGPLHPGGEVATSALLDRAGVTAGTRLLDVGCGAGGAVSLARDRGAAALGVDTDPAGGPAVRGRMERLPVGAGAVDVVLSECTLCLAEDLEVVLAEVSRVLTQGGRLALSDVVLEGELPEVPARIAEALCLSGRRDREWLGDRVESAGFAVVDRQDHRDELLAMRDQLDARVDYFGLLRALGDRGEELATCLERLERAVEDGTVGYVSIVAQAER